MTERLYLVTFGRVGRSNGIRPTMFNARGAEDLAEQVHRRLRRYLASSWFDVSVDLESGRGLIEAGRFGEFTVEDRGEFEQ